MERTSETRRCKHAMKEGALTSSCEHRGIASVVSWKERARRGRGKHVGEGANTLGKEQRRRGRYDHVKEGTTTSRKERLRLRIRTTSQEEGRSSISREEGATMSKQVQPRLPGRSASGEGYSPPANDHVQAVLADHRSEIAGPDDTPSVSRDKHTV